MSPKDIGFSSASISSISAMIGSSAATIWARCASVSWWSFACLGSIYPPESLLPASSVRCTQKRWFPRILEFPETGGDGTSDTRAFPLPAAFLPRCKIRQKSLISAFFMASENWHFYAPDRLFYCVQKLVLWRTDRLFYSVQKLPFMDWQNSFDQG